MIVVLKRIPSSFRHSRAAGNPDSLLPYGATEESTPAGAAMTDIRYDCPESI